MLDWNILRLDGLIGHIYGKHGLRMKDLYENRLENEGFI